LNPLLDTSEHSEIVTVTSLRSVCALLFLTAREKSPLGAYSVLNSTVACNAAASRALGCGLRSGPVKRRDGARDYKGEGGEKSLMLNTILSSSETPIEISRLLFCSFLHFTSVLFPFLLDSPSNPFMQNCFVLGRSPKSPPYPNPPPGRSRPWSTKSHMNPPRSDSAYALE
jgi:hypothetical protein